MTGLNESVISKAFGLPSEGQQFCDNTVLASGVDIENNRWFVITDGTVQRTAAQEALKPSLNRTKYFTHDDRVFEAISGSKFQMEVVRTNPSGGVQTVIGGSMSYTRVRKNPVSVADFRSEMNDMFVSDPRRDFKEYDAPKLHSEAFRDRLFTFVSYRGESYGWVKGGKIYHRRGSLIMPKLKVNKAVEGATVFYHTHPSKDEPSLSSADDYQFYADLAFAFGIKHFYTIMENRIDHFTFSVKKSKEEDYLKMDEDKLLDDLNAMIDEAEASVTKKHKGNKNMTDEKFYETITRSAVTKMNSRFKQFFTISYKGHAKPGLVRENPGVAGFRHNPPVRISHIHRASQLDELRDTTNNYEHYGANEFGHSHYVYWWIDHHFSATPAHPKARLWKLKEYGLSDEARRKLRAYMSEEVAPGYSKLDILLFLALYHDVGKKREKEEGRHHSIIGAEMFRDEISVELKLPEQVTDTVVHLMMTDVGRKNIDPEVFRTKAGDYLGVAYMLQLADMLAHHPFMYTSYAAEAKEQGLIDKANVHRYKQFAAEQHISNVTKFLNSRVINNPPPKAVSAYFSGSFDTAIDGDIAQIEFSEWEDPDKTMFYNAQLRMRDPVHGVKVTLFLTSGKFIIYFGKDSNRIEGDATFYDTAMDIYRRMGDMLSNFTTGMDFESPPEPDIMVNPRHVDKVHLITISGPSGVGKSTIAKTLAGILDADLIPTVTTRPRRPKEKGNRDRIFITEKQFKEMIEDGAFVEWKRLKNGFYYGRRYSDFKKPVAVIDVTLKGMKKYRDVFPHTTSIFLDPDVSPEELKKRILRRGGMTPEEAEARANIAAKQIEDAHKMDFDMFVKSKTGGFEDVAKQIANDIEIIKQNPIAYDAQGVPHMLPSEEAVEMALMVDLVNRGYDSDTAKKTADFTMDSLSDSESITGSGNRREVMTKELFVNGAGNRITGFALERIEVRGAGNRIEVIAPVGVKITEQGSGNRMNIRRLSPNDFAKAIYEATSKGNPSTNFFPGEAVEQYPWLRHADLIKQNVPIFDALPSPEEYVAQRIQAGSKLTPNGHQFRNTVSSSRSMGLEGASPREIISLAFTRKVQGLYEPFKQDAQRVGFMAIKAHVNKERYPRIPDWDKKVKGDWANKVWTIDEMIENGGVCRHLALLSGLLLERAIEDGVLKGQVYYFRGPRHGWVVFRDQTGRDFLIDPAQGKWQILGDSTYWDGEEHRRYADFSKIPDSLPQRTLRGLQAQASPEMKAMLRSNPKEGPDLFSHFERWAKLVNMKNKELKAFLDSPLGKVAGLSPQEAKEQGIFSGRVSGRRILKMRAKIGLGGPKDYIKGPVHAMAVFQRAKRKWTGPSKDYMNGTTDWDWCMRQVRFNTRHGAFPYNKAAEDKKGPLIKKQKTQNQVSRRLLGLWVWGHDPWRWARKHGIARMPKCPDVPWVGMTEKRKYGKVPVLMKPTKKNPPAFEFSQDPAKRKKRWDKITRSTPEQLRKMAFDMAEEARVRIEIQQEQLPPLRMKNVPKSIADEIEKWYYSSVDSVSFWMGRKNQIAILSRKVVHRPIPKTVKDWILNYSTKHKSKQKAPSISGLGLFRYNPRRGMSVGHDGRWAGLPYWRSGKERKIPAKSFPLMYDAGGGYVEEEKQFQGYYGIIKMLEASYLEQHGIEGYGMGSSLQRAEYYRSFGWLMPQDVSKYAPYVHDGPRSYLLLDEGDVLGWDSSMEFIWRPVYSKPKKNPQTGLPGIGEPPVDPATIEPHLDWPTWAKPDWFPRNLVPQSAVFSPARTTTVRGRKMRKPAFYYIRQDELNRLLQSQQYLELQEAERQRKIAEAERIRAQHQGTVEDYHTNPRIPKKYEGQDPSEHSDLYTDEEPTNTIQGLGFKDKETALRSINIIRRSGKTHAHKIQAAMAMEQRARFHPSKTKGIREAQKVYERYIEEMKEKTKERRNPRTFSGIKEAHEHYGYAGSHRTGTIIKDGIVIRTYSNNEGHDIVKDGGDVIRYMVKTPKIRSAFLTTRKQGKHLRFFLKTGPNEVTDMGMYEVGRLSGDFVNLRKASKSNPPNIPFPVPEEYQEELERRLTEEMTAEGYRPLRVQQDFIDSGGYDDAPSDWSYVQGEYQEFLDEIEAQDWDEAYAEYSDVEGHTAYYLWTNYRIDMPVYTHDHIDKVLFRIRIFEDLFAHYGFEFGPQYLKGGSNYEKVFKVRNALDAAADAQGKPRVTDDDEQLGAVVKQLVAARKAMNNPAPMGLEADFEAMKRTAKRNRELEMTEGFDAHGWWKSQKGVIDEKYGKEAVAGASWLMPVFDPDFDPYADPNSIDDFYPDGEPNMHFYNQLMRIPQTEPPTPRKILQIALNIGQGQATGIVDEDYTMSDFIAFDNPRTPGGKKVPTRYLKGLTKLERMIAEDEIDKGYKYDTDDPEAYKFWKSDIKATARGLKIGTSKHRTKYYKMYRKNIDKDYKPAGKSPKEKFLNRIRKETKIKRSILEKIYDKGLAAWRTGHRPGVQQHQWAAGRVYAFAVGADSSTGPGKPDHKLAVEAGVR